MQMFFRPRALSLIALLNASLLVVSGCGGGAAPEPPGSAAPPGSSYDDVVAKQKADAVKPDAKSKAKK